MSRPTLAAYRAAAPHPARRRGGRRASDPLAPGAAGSPRVDSRSGPPRITVVTVVRDAREALEETLASVLAQGYPGLEHVVVDGGSTDGTVELLEAHGDALDLWISEPDNGIYDAMNKGIALAEGDLVAMLNAGDRYFEGALAAVAETFRAGDPEAIYFGDALVHYTDLDLVLHARAEPAALTHRAAVCHQAVFVPLAVHAAGGLYDPGYRLASDYAFLAGESFAGRAFHDLARPVVVYRNDGLSSQSQFARYRREMVAFHRRSDSGHLARAAAFASFEVALFHAHALLRPLFGARRADALKRWFFRRRANVVTEVDPSMGEASPRTPKPTSGA